MVGRILHFSRPYHLSVRLSQLVITDKDTGEILNRPIEDTAVLMLEHPQLTYTHALMQELMAHNVAVVFCGADYHPAGMVLPLAGNVLQHQRFKSQLEASQPLKKQLWQQTVKAKIQNQAAMLDSIGKHGLPLRQMASEVKSGDSENHEARAARAYWSQLFLHEFRREREGGWPNSALNYGYAVLRAATARAIVAAGLLPTLGIHHSNKYNAYCLADDLMEPYRPFVDAEVVELQQLGMDDLTKEAKAKLIGVVLADVKQDGQKGPMMAALHRTAQSLVKCFEQEGRKLSYPQLQ
jgi:CRISPR-associated protein Cas1